MVAVNTLSGIMRGELRWLSKDESHRAIDAKIVGLKPHIS